MQPVSYTHLVKRAKLVAKYAEKRAALKQIVRTGDLADAFEAAQKLQELPKNSNPIRMHNRCKLTGLSLIHIFTTKTWLTSQLRKL